MIFRDCFCVTKKFVKMAINLNHILINHYDIVCRTVPAGSHEASAFNGFHQQTMRAQIVMKPNTASYKISSTDPEGHRCMSR